MRLEQSLSGVHRIQTAIEGSRGQCDADGTSVEVYLINLDRRKDRLKWSQSQLERHQITFRRIAAIDKEDAKSRARNFNFREFRGFSLTDGELGCFLSHFKAWSDFIETGKKYCLVLEDDVLISRSLRYFLNRLRSVDIEANIIRLETYFRRVRLTRQSSNCFGNIALHKLHSSHWGAAAYILHRDFTAKLLGCGEFPALPVDHLLFNPVSPFFDKERTFQVVPALCVQGHLMPGNQTNSIYYSDLKPERSTRNAVAKLHRRTRETKLRREILRIMNQIGRWSKLATWRPGTRWTTVPFSCELQNHPVSPIRRKPLLVELLRKRNRYD
jgi:glycosyl transferase family 25